MWCPSPDWMSFLKIYSSLATSYCALVAKITGWNSMVCSLLALNIMDLFIFLRSVKRDTFLVPPFHQKPTSLLGFRLAPRGQVSMSPFLAPTGAFSLWSCRQACVCTGPDSGKHPHRGQYVCVPPYMLSWVRPRRDLLTSAGLCMDVRVQLRGSESKIEAFAGCLCRETNVNKPWRLKSPLTLRNDPFM